MIRPNDDAGRRRDGRAAWAGPREASRPSSIRTTGDDKDRRRDGRAARAGLQWASRPSSVRTGPKTVMKQG
eukprot:3287076-Pyramimonas_sp.AAC.1